MSEGGRDEKLRIRGWTADKPRIMAGNYELPLEANTNFFTPFFRRQNGQRRRAFGQCAIAGVKIVAVAVVGTAQQTALEKLPGDF